MKEKILIFNVNWLGDVLFSTATIRNIRYNYPDSYIACIIPPRCLPVLEGNPYLNEIIIFDEKKKHKSFFGKINFILELRKKNFDKVFLLHRSFSRALITYLAGIKERIGYYTKKRAFLLTKKLLAPNIENIHRVDYYLDVLKQAGLKITDRDTNFYFSKDDEQVVDDFIKKNNLESAKILVGLNPGGNWDPKRWPKEYFVSLADALINKFQAKIIITGGPEDRELATWIASNVKGSVLVSAGVFSLKQSAALLKKLDFFITADSGPMHIAAAVGTKNIIALFGPTKKELTGPVQMKNVKIVQNNVGCKIPCYMVNCKDNRCMKAITVEDVLEKL